MYLEEFFACRDLLEEARDEISNLIDVSIGLDAFPFGKKFLVRNKDGVCCYIHVEFYKRRNFPISKSNLKFPEKG